MKERVNSLYTTPHYSTKLWRAYKIYLGQHYGKNLFTEICDEIGISENYLNKDDNWVSDLFTRKFMDILIRKTGDENIARKVGQFSISPEAVNNLEYALVKILSPLLFFRLVKFNASKLNRFHDLELSHVKRGMFVFEMTTKEAHSSDLHVYQNTAGLIEAAKDLYNLDKLEVSYTISTTSQNQQKARFEIFYSSKTWILGQILKLVATASALVGFFLFCKNNLSSMVSYTQYLPLLATIFAAILGIVGFIILKLMNITKYLSTYYRQEKEKSQDLYVSSVKLERRFQEAQLLKHLSSELIGCIDPRQVIEKCIHSINEKFSYHMVAIFLLSKERGKLYLAQGIGFEETEMDASKIEFTYPNPDKKDGFIATVLENGKTVLIDDIESYKSGLKPFNQHLIEKLNVGSMIISPIFSGKEKFGSILVIKNRTEEHLNSQDRFLIENISAQLSLYFESATNFENEKKLKHIFQKYVPSTVLEQISQSLHTSDGSLRPQKKEICSVFMDLRGFTTACDSLPPEKAFDLINHFANFTTKILSEEGAIIDNIIGDEVVSFFLKRENSPTYHITAALKSVLRIRKEFNELNKIFRLNGIPSLRLGIGVHVGEASIGSVGGEAKMNFTAIGSTVNVAARLQTLTKKYTDETVCIISSKALLDQVYPSEEFEFETEILRGTSERTSYVRLIGQNENLILQLLHFSSIEAAG